MPTTINGTTGIDLIQDGAVSSAAKLATGVVTGAKIQDGSVSATDLATGAVNSQTLTLLNATGSAPVYACRAWVNFNGTGTVSIRASGNVSSITDIGVGDYVVNFITAMQSNLYIVVLGSARAAADETGNVTHDSSFTTTSAGVSTFPYNSVTRSDCTGVSVAIFR